MKSKSFLLSSFKNQKFEIGFFGLSLVVFLFMGLNHFISHSEFWSIAISKILGHPNAAANNYKFLFYLPLKLFYVFPLSNVEHIQMVRLFFGGMAFACFFLFLLNIRAMDKKPLNWMIFGIFLLSFQIYFYNSFRIRADLISNFFIIMAYTLINRDILNNRPFKTFDLKILILCSLAFLSTPKSIYMISTIIIYRAYLYYKSPSDLLKLSLNFIFSAFLPISFFLVVNEVLFRTGVFNDSPYLLALRYHFNSMESIFSSNLWNEVYISLKLNLLNWILIFMGLIYFLKHEKNMGKLLKGQIVLFLLVLFVLIIHPEKWSYFIAQLIPFLSLPFLFTLRLMDNPFKKLAVISCVFLSIFSLTPLSTFYRSNSKQMEVIKELEKIVKSEPSENYFDSMGLLPREKSLLVFLGPNDPESRLHALAALYEKPPGFIFMTTKVRKIDSKIHKFLLKKYRAYKPDVWIHKRLEKSYEFNSSSQPLYLEKIFAYDFVPVLKN